MSSRDDKKTPLRDQENEQAESDVLKNETYYFDEDDAAESVVEQESEYFDEEDPEEQEPEFFDEEDPEEQEPEFFDEEDPEEQEPEFFDEEDPKEPEQIDAPEADGGSAEASGPDDQSGTDSDEKPKVWKKVLKITSLTILGLLLAAYLGGAGYFYMHFGPNSIVNGVDVSYLNVEQVQDVIREQVKGYSLKVMERKEATETIRGADVGLEYVPDDQVRTILHAQNCLIWPYRMIADLQADEGFTHASVQLDEKKFSDIVAGLDCANEELMIAPADAYPALEGSIYAAHPEEEGTTILPDVLEKVLKEALLSTVDSVDLDANGCYTDPEIRADDPEIKKICDTKNELIGLSITYHFGDQIVVLDGSTTDAWITWDKDLKPTIDEEKIKEWAKGFGKEHDTIGKPRTFTGAAGREVTVSGGSYGWSVDEEAEIEMVKAMFANKESQDREPIWATTAASHDTLDWGNTYIEVDVATQHMWYFKDGQVIFEDDVVTGLPTAARQTTPGVWSILEMKRNKVLRGTRLSDGSYEYETPVAYWMRVTWTGIGFHDATWQPAFGGNRYTYAGSHGCINMSYSGAQALYDIAYEGLPVIVHQ